MVAVSVAAGGIVNSWIAAVDIFAYSRIINSYIIVCNIYLTIWIAAENIACYCSIAIDSYIAAADTVTIISFANTENIAYCTAGNSYRCTVAVNIIVSTVNYCSTIIWRVKIYFRRCWCCRI